MKHFLNLSKYKSIATDHDYNTSTYVMAAFMLTKLRYPKTTMHAYHFHNFHGCFCWLASSSCN